MKVGETYEIKDRNGKEAILRWLTEMLERNRLGKPRFRAPSVPNKPIADNERKAILQLGARMTENGMWRGDISTEIRKMPGGENLDDLYF